MVCMVGRGSKLDLIPLQWIGYWNIDMRLIGVVNLLKAIMYTALGSLMTWCWLMGHNYLWHTLGFVWAAVFAVDIVRFAFPRRD